MRKTLDSVHVSVEPLDKSESASQSSRQRKAAAKPTGPKEAPKKRGRKLTEPDKYFFESDKKINEWKAKLKNDKTLSSDEKQKLRN